ncbi:MAG: heavy metal translocating P-type ATPase [Elusimicrobia bacterium]|nr:heavy metal translocating P-type ATPase [Elusimicrobiota bacterium]
MTSKAVPQEANLKKAVIPLEGVHCASCVERIESGLAAMPGIRRASVHLLSKTAFLVYDSALVSTDKITAKIRELGYKALAVSESPIQAENIAAAELEREKHRFLKKFAASLAAAGFLLLGHFSGFSPYTMMLAAAFSWGWCGSHFHFGLLRSLKAKTADMNTLVSLSASVTFFYGVFVTLFPSAMSSHFHAQWHEVAMLIAFVNLGRFLEARSKSRAAGAISNLFKIVPKFARRLKDGKEELLRVEEVVPGDLVLLRPGEQAPVDGEVINGFSSVDESLLTGEAIPQEKAAGSKIYAGTINKNGTLEFSATGVGEDMALMKIIKAVEESQASKSPVQHLVDRISAWFVPAVILIAIASFGVWLHYTELSRAVNVFAAVLAVACPCAMGLAVPMAVAVGFARAAGLGMLINNAEVLERISKIDVVIFDKTGTITEGRLKVSRLRPWKIGEKKFLELLLSAEARSEHPFAEAVRLYAQEKNTAWKSPSAIEAAPGKGIIAMLSGRRILAGSAKWFTEQGIALPGEIQDEIKGFNGSLLLLAENGAFKGYAALADSMRPEAPGLVAELSAMGIESVIASGDRAPVVREAAAALGIKDYYAEVFPDEKRRIVLRHKALGKKVAVVGDGFNDAEALSEADIGIALRSGADIAVRASDITLMHNGIAGVAAAVKISKAIRRVIVENLLWAFGYNIILIPLAAGVLYPSLGLVIPPHFAGGAMALSSVSVVFNSLRLRRMKI